MKQLTTLLIISLVALPACDRGKKNQQPVTTTPVSEPEPLFRHVESPNDTTLPTTPKPKDSFRHEE